MPQFPFEAWRRGALCGAFALIAACGNQSSAPPATASAPVQSAPADAPPAAQQQNATVAELLSGSDSQSADSQSSAAGPPASAQQPPANSDVAATADADEYARVVSVAPVTGPHRVCTDETVTERRKPNDQHQVAGTVIGAIAGGVIGHQIGGGRGRDLATVGGAVGGGVVGKQIQKNQQSKDTVTRVVKHCRMVDESTAGAPVYDVVYAYQGQNFHVRVDHDPGDRIALPVRGVVE